MALVGVGVGVGWRFKSRLHHVESVEVRDVERVAAAKKKPNDENENERENK